MAFSTPTTARWTILSSSAAIASGRRRPSALGMYVRRDGAPDTLRCGRAHAILEIAFQVRLVFLPRHPVDPGGGVRLSPRTPSSVDRR